jgi:hypothetical protein
MIKEAFERGFINTAVANGFNILEATQLLKKAMSISDDTGWG